MRYVMLAGVVLVCLSGCDALLDFDQLRDGHGDGGSDHHGDLAGSDLSGDMAAAFMPDGGCTPPASGPFFDDANITDIPLTTGNGRPASIAAIDVNKDQKVDFVFSGDDGKVYVWTNNGNRTFTQLAAQASGCPSGDFSLTTLVGDFDKDGNVDVLVNCQEQDESAVTNGLYFLKGMGNGTFAAAMVMTNPPMFTFAGLAYDLDNDGTSDAIVYDGNSNLYVFWGGTGFVAQMPLEVSDVLPDNTALNEITGGTVSDNGNVNGGLVLVYAGTVAPGGGGFQIVRQAPTRTISVDTTSDLIVASDTNEPMTGRLGKLNGDSLPDLVSALYEPGQTAGAGNAAGLLNLYSGEFFASGTTYSTTPTDSVSTPPSPFHLALGDLNNDAFDDVVLTHFQSTSDMAYYDRFEVWTPVTASGSTKLQCVFQHSVTSTTAAALEVDHPTTADVDGDGHADIVLTMDYTGTTPAPSAIRIAWGKPGP